MLAVNLECLATMTQAGRTFAQQKQPLGIVVHR